MIQKHVLCQVLITLSMMFLWERIYAQQAWIRINQLGYREADVKVAVMGSKEPIECTRFEVVDAATHKVVYEAKAVKYFGKYGPFAHTWRLNFSPFSRKGIYYIKAGSIKSPEFKIDNRVYEGTADFVLKYMRQQRSKYNPFLKDSCHTKDGFIVYHPDKNKDSTYIDVAGGWHDASDYLQYLPTSANATFQMMFAFMQHPESFQDKYDAWGNEGSNNIPDVIDEAKWGLDWLVKMNPGKGEYYNQIADDRDHQGMRLPTLDSVVYAPNKGFARPVYFITGKPQGEKYKNKTVGAASSAGKFATAFAIGAQVMKPYYPQFAESLVQKAIDAYEFGKQHPGNTQTISVVSPYIYAEDNYADDMELAAITLFKLTGDSVYLKDAIQFAHMEPVTPWMGADSANHYQWYPFVNLGHYFGAKLDHHNRDTYIRYMREGIQRVVNRGKNNPFLIGVPFIWCSNNLVVGMLTQMSLYRKITGDKSFEEEEAALRDWLFGCNPWGTSMICDLPENGIAPKDPHSAFTHLYNYKISGGLVDGPVYGSIWNKLIGIKLYAPDEFEAFQSDVAVYHDDYGDYSTNEPTMDGTASLSYYLSMLQSDTLSRLEYDKEGGVIKIDSDKKHVYLLFSAHEFAEGGKHVVETLARNKVKGNFFFTGDFLRNKKHCALLQQLHRQGHYIGSHSDKHLLYADWTKRDSLLVSKDSFKTDLEKSLEQLRKLNIESGKWYLPPYEWYNKQIVEWCKELGLTVLNFTPGTGTNADYTWPGLKNYRSSGDLLQHLFKLDEKILGGSLLLIHLGTDPRRKDKFYNKLDIIIKHLQKNGFMIKKLPN